MKKMRIGYLAFGLILGNGLMLEGRSVYRGLEKRLESSLDVDATGMNSTAAPNAPVPSELPTGYALSGNVLSAPLTTTVVAPAADMKAINHLIQEGSQGFDIQAKKQTVKQFVERAASYLEANGLSIACDAFIHADMFKCGDLRIFCLDTKGNYYAHGADKTIVWQNLLDLTDVFKTPLVQNIIKTAESGSGWTSYLWRGETKVTYVKRVVKDGVTYIVGSGYFANSKADEAVSMVKGAVSLFNELIIKQDYPVEEVFSSLSYPMGRFVYGDLYTFAMDFEGNIVANGDRPGLIGTNAFNYQDARGKMVNQEIITKLKNNSTAGVWVEAYSKGASKLIYAERVVDKKGKEYFIATRYYPTISREKVIDLVKNSYEFIKRNGKTVAAEAFNSRTDEQFRLGELTITVVDQQGIVVANGSNPEKVGSSMWDEKDEDGMYFVRELIERGQQGGGWVNYRDRGSFKSTYVESVKLGTDTCYIFCGIYPVSKQETTILMLNSAVSYLRANSVIESFRTFVDKKGPFIRGDLSVTVYDNNGICLVSGEDYERLWKNMLDAKDQDGKPYVRLLINGVKRGPVKLTYRLDNATRVDYAQQIQKDGNIYIVVCGYFM